MAKNIYDELVKSFDRLSFGFPKGLLGSEKMVLKKFFNEDDARYFIDMGQGYLTVSEYAEKNGLDADEAERRLEQLACKGLVFRRRRPERTEYKQYPFMMGLIEFQTHLDDHSWAAPLGLWMFTSPFGERMTHSMPMYRTIPFEQDFSEDSTVLPYDKVRELLDKHEVFSLMPCLCRTIFQMKPGNKCNHPIDTCIMTDDYARFILDNGWGREITRQEAYDILMAGREDGRIMNVVNSQDGENICSCCSCGCGLLYLKKKYPGPGAHYWSSYFAVHDPEKCVSCGRCDRCPMDALTFKKGAVRIDTQKCLGCGICVSYCKTGALALNIKDEDDRLVPPETYDDAIEIWQNERK